MKVTSYEDMHRLEITSQAEGKPEVYFKEGVMHLKVYHASSSSFAERYTVVELSVEEISSALTALYPAKHFKFPTFIDK